MITKLKLEIQKERLKHFPCYIFISTLFVGGEGTKELSRIFLICKMWNNTANTNCSIIQWIYERHGCIQVPSSSKFFFSGLTTCNCFKPLTA